MTAWQRMTVVLSVLGALALPSWGHAQTGGDLPAANPGSGDPFPPEPPPSPPTPPPPQPKKPAAPVAPAPPGDVPPLPPSLPPAAGSAPEPPVPPKPSNPVNPPIPAIPAIAATPAPVTPAIPATPPKGAPVLPPLPPPAPAPTAADLGLGPLPTTPAAPPPIGPSPPPPSAKCQPPKGHKGPFTPPKGCPPPKKAPETLSHGGQFVVQLSLLELPYLFNRVTERSASDSRVGWIPSVGIGFGSGPNETLVKLGVGVNRYADDTAFSFGLERRRYFGTGTVKGIFAWNLMFSAGGAVTFTSLFGVGLGLQIDTSRRVGYYVMLAPGFVFTVGGSNAQGQGNEDAGFALTTHAGVQFRF